MFGDLEEIEAEQEGARQNALIEEELTRALEETKVSLTKKRKDTKKDVSAVAKLRKKFKDRGDDLKRQLASERGDQELAARSQAAECTALGEKLECARRVHKDMKPFVQKYLKGKGGAIASPPEAEAAVRDLSVMVNKLLEAQKKRDKEAASRMMRIDRLEKRVEDSIRHLLDQVNALSSGAHRVTFEVTSAAEQEAPMLPPLPPLSKGRRTAAASRSFVKSPVDLHRDMLLGKRLETDPSYVPGFVPPHLLCE